MAVANNNLIVDDNFDIDDSGRGRGPKIGCVGCQEDVVTYVVADPALYRRFGVGGPFHTLDCPNCLEDLTDGFSL